MRLSLPSTRCGQVVPSALGLGNALNTIAQSLSQGSGRGLPGLHCGARGKLVPHTDSTVNPLVGSFNPRKRPGTLCGVCSVVRESADGGPGACPLVQAGPAGCLRQGSKAPLRMAGGLREEAASSVSPTQAQGLPQGAWGRQLCSTRKLSCLGLAFVSAREGDSVSPFQF